LIILKVTLFLAEYKKDMGTYTSRITLTYSPYVYLTFTQK